MEHPDDLLNPRFTFDPDFDWTAPDLFDYPCSGTFLGYGEEMGVLPVRGYSQRFNRQGIEDIKKDIARQGAEIAEMRAFAEAELYPMEQPEIFTEPPVETRTSPTPSTKRKGTRLNGPTRD